MKLIVANFKSHLDNQEVASHISRLRALPEPGAEVVVCPSFVSIITAFDCARGSFIQIGAQDVSEHGWGPHTGEVCSPMLKDFCSYVIVGHSERRQAGDDDASVNRKLKAAISAGIQPILCIGEDQHTNASGRTRDFLKGQLVSALAGIRCKGITVAYEPLWAISKGEAGHEAAGHELISSIHAFIRSELDRMGFAPRVIYGGSVRPDNAAGILGAEGVDGALVGSASLDPGSFMAIAGST